MNSTFRGRLRPQQSQPTDWTNLTNLTNEKLAFVYQRLSSHEQLKRSIYSIKAQDALEDLAIEDGYQETLSKEEIKTIKDSAHYLGWYQNGDIIVEQRDMGISGTKGRENRPGLEHLIQKIEAGQVEAIYVIHVSRLYRDQTLINALSLGELFKEYNVIIVTPHMRLNLKDKMHMRVYRMEVERAADELELMAHRLNGAKNLKAKAGYYAGEAHPPGYVIDEQKTLPTGEANPGYHTYQIYEPHAEVVRIVFELLLKPDMGPTHVVRYCKQQGIYFPTFPPELNTPANRKTFAQSASNGAGWLVTRQRVYSIAQNPAYIGWKIWSGEVVSKEALPPIIDKETFWTVQKRFITLRRSPKRDNDPLPLAGLLYCADHATPQKMGFVNAHGRTPNIYQCCDRGLDEYCATIAAHILDGPICEAVLGEIGTPELTSEVLDQLTDEYEEAKERASGYRREMRRLEAEIENLRNNMATGVLSTKQLAWLDEQIVSRMDQVRELADLEKQPIGEIVGKPVPGLADIDMVRLFLENLDRAWGDTPNVLKNAFLAIMLKRVLIWPETTTIRVQLIWHTDLTQELIIYRPLATDARPGWTEAEVEILRQHYPVTDQNELLAMLPGRTWRAIRCKARNLRVRREPHFRPGKGEPYTQEEDDVIRLYYAGEITMSECSAQLGRTIESISKRAKRLGLWGTWQRPQTTWEWVRRTMENDRLSK